MRPPGQGQPGTPRDQPSRARSARPGGAEVSRAPRTWTWRSAGSWTRSRPPRPTRAAAPSRRSPSPWPPSLCAMTAGLSGRHLPAAERLAEQARLLRDRAAPLAQADAEAYRRRCSAATAGQDTAVGPAQSDRRAVARHCAVADGGGRDRCRGGCPRGRRRAPRATRTCAATPVTAALLCGSAAARAAATAGADQPRRGRGRRPTRPRRAALAAEAARLAAEAEQTAR